MTHGSTPTVEYRTRVMCYLPANNAAEVKVVYDLINHLEKQRKQPLGLLGFTRSAFAPPVYAGYWRHSIKEKLLQEKVVVFTLDYDADIEKGAVLQAAAQLKTFIRNAYQRHTGIEQDEIWMVAQPIVRIV
jgi:hypothetical protein